MATVAQTAETLCSLCREGRFRDAMESLYAPDIVSIEPVEMPGMPARTEGVGAVRAKADAWLADNEVHEVRVDGPFVGGNQFAVRYWMDVTSKQGGRMQFEEMALYTVRDGKIVKEEFYYNQPGM
jgi:ketosteroid isomerase-like protein